MRLGQKMTEASRYCSRTAAALVRPNESI